jgi:uncharacterized protein
VRIFNQTKNVLIAEKGYLADTALSRLKGLLSRNSIDPQEGLIITQCRSIHMLFMKFSIDVLFVDKNKKVVGLVPCIKPFRFSPYFFRAQYAIELFPGSIEKTKTAKGDILSF